MFSLLQSVRSKFSSSFIKPMKTSSSSIKSFQFRSLSSLSSRKFQQIPANSRLYHRSYSMFDQTIAATFSSLSSSRKSRQLTATSSRRSYSTFYDETLATSLSQLYCPVFKFHENEKFFPCSIEHLLTNSELRDRENPTWVIQNPTTNHIADYYGCNFFIKINTTQYPGHLPSAPMYYTFQQENGLIKIHYVLLFAWQGGQTIRTRRTFKTFDMIISPFGKHQGDLERVVVTLQPLSSGMYEVANVGFEAHGDVKEYTADKLNFEDTTHPVVHVALHGHSPHNRKVTSNPYVEDDAIVFAVTSDLRRNEAEDSGIVWRPYRQSTPIFKRLGLDDNHEPIGDQIWAKFHGKIGEYRDNKKLQSATYLNHKGLSSDDWAFVKFIDFGAQLAYPDRITKGYAPQGPGGRTEWIYSTKRDFKKCP